MADGRLSGPRDDAAVNHSTRAERYQPLTKLQKCNFQAIKLLLPRLGLGTCVLHCCANMPRAGRQSFGIFPIHVGAPDNVPGDISGDVQRNQGVGAGAGVQPFCRD
eukprot:1156164-Amphidinium_carterae.1